MKLLMMILTFVFFIGCKQIEMNKNILSISKLSNSKIENIGRTPQADRSESCEKYCSKLNLYKQKFDDGFSYLSFANFGYRGIGRCRGHAMLTQKLSILATFIDSPSCDLALPDCMAEYRRGINKIKNYQTHEFVGFKNLLEFSTHPKIKKVLWGIVAGTSNRYKTGRARIQDTSHETHELNIFYELKRRSYRGELPYVGVLGAKTGAHGLLITKTDYIGNQAVLCARDSNIVLDTAEDCENYFYVENKEIYYKRMGKTPDKMFKFNLTGDEDKRVTKYTAALKTSCINKSRRARYCK